MYETEYSYIITSPEVPLEIGERYAGDRDPRLIYDTYYDTLANTLTWHKYSFRKRCEVGKKPVYCLKGPTKDFKRLEIESKDYSEIQSKVLDRFPNLWGMKLQPKQKRVTARKVYPFCDAKLCIDHTWINFKASYWNLEIESTNEGSTRGINHVKREVEKRYDITPWPHSKYATGVAINALGIEGELNAPKFLAVSQYIERCM